MSTTVFVVGLDDENQRVPGRCRTSASSTSTTSGRCRPLQLAQLFVAAHTEREMAEK